jgi:signal transduction histidine kinase
LDSTRDIQVLAKDVRLVRRARWLIGLRWMAIGGVCAGTAVAHTVAQVVRADLALYGVALLLALENLVSLLSLRWIVRLDAGVLCIWVRRLIHFQIGTDLVLLTVLLHFSGGVENPLIICFVFHMVIASTLLSVRGSYVQATVAVCLLGAMALLEYRGMIAHFYLNGLLTRNFYADGPYVCSEVAVLAGTIFLVVYITTDIASQLRRQEEAYRRANAALQQKDRLKNEYVARVTHDIKGHLAAIQSCHHVILGELLGPLTVEQREFVDRACRRTAHLSNFVRTLLRLTELQLSKRLETSVVSLDQVIEQAVSACEGRAREKAITLTYRMESSGIEVSGDGMAIEEAICNLLLNSVKYTPAEGRIDLVASVEADHVKVAICDTGIGVPEVELPRIFDEFYRASNAREVEKDGTGLGLSIVKHIIERHGGGIGVESREGSGSVFTFTLPLLRTSGEKRISTPGLTIGELTLPTKDRTKSEVH